MYKVLTPWGLCTYLYMWVVWWWIFVIGHLADPISTFYKVDIVGSAAHGHNTTQQPIWATATLPPRGFALSLQGMVSGAPHTWRWGCQSTNTRRRHRLCGWRGWFPCLGCKQWPIKRQRDERGVDLRWPWLNRNTQQSTKSLQLWYKALLGGGTAGVERVGGACSHCLGCRISDKKFGHKINVDLKRPPMDDRTLNTQPKTGGRNWRWYGKEAWTEESLGGGD